MHLYETCLTDINNFTTIYMSHIITKIFILINPLLYILLFGYIFYMLSVIIKSIKKSHTLYAPVKKGLKTFAINFFITFGALLLARYNSFISEFFWNPPVILGYDVITSDMQMLDEIFQKALDLGNYLKQKSNIEHNIIYQSIYFMVSIQVYLFGFAITMYPVYMILLSKLALATLFVVAPFLILFNMYKPSKRLFNVWIDSVYYYSMMALMTSLAVQYVILLTE